VFIVIGEDIECLDSLVLADGLYSLVVMGSGGVNEIDSYVNFSVVNNEMYCEDLEEEKSESVYCNDRMVDFIDVVINNWWEDERNVCIIRLF